MQGLLAALNARTYDGALGRSAYRGAYGAIARLLYDDDPIGLRHHGFPDNEFGPEAAALLAALACAGTDARRHKAQGASPESLVQFFETSPPLLPPYRADEVAGLLTIIFESWFSPAWVRNHDFGPVPRKSSPSSARRSAAPWSPPPATPRPPVLTTTPTSTGTR